MKKIIRIFNKRYLKIHMKKACVYFCKHICWVFGFILAVAFVFVAAYSIYNWFWESEQSFFAYSEEAQEALDLYFQFTRKLGWTIWAGISTFALVVTFFLTIWGRKLQQKQWEIHKDQWETQEKQWQTQNKTHQLQLESHLQERYENSCSMLGNEVMAVRIAGFQTLKNLTIDDKSEDKSIKLQCARLLFAFIKNPYLGDDEKESAHDEHEENKKTASVPPAKLTKSKLLEYVFPSYEILRDDIQEAVDILFFIYQDYGDEELYKEEFELPNYFLKNKHKKPISLARVNLRGVTWKDAYLSHANFQGVNFKNANLKNAKLKHANLRRAKFQNAILTDTKMQSANFKNAKFQNANLKNAMLWRAKLQSANFKNANLINVKLRDANLEGAILKGADITDADMREVENLTKKQILSAIWGNDEFGLSIPPSLPEELVDDPEVQEWLATPRYDLGEE